MLLLVNGCGSSGGLLLTKKVGTTKKMMDCFWWGQLRGLARATPVTTSTQIIDDCAGAFQRPQKQHYHNNNDNFNQRRQLLLQQLSLNLKREAFSRENPVFEQHKSGRVVAEASESAESFLKSFGGVVDQNNRGGYCRRPREQIVKEEPFFNNARQQKLSHHYYSVPSQQNHPAENAQENKNNRNLISHRFLSSFSPFFFPKNNKNNCSDSFHCRQNSIVDTVIINTNNSEGVKLFVAASIDDKVVVDNDDPWGNINNNVRGRRSMMSPSAGACPPMPHALVSMAATAAVSTVRRRFSTTATATSSSDSGCEGGEGSVFSPSNTLSTLSLSPNKTNSDNNNDSGKLLSVGLLKPTTETHHSRREFSTTTASALFNSSESSSSLGSSIASSPSSLSPSSASSSSASPFSTSGSSEDNNKSNTNCQGPQQKMPVAPSTLFTLDRSRKGIVVGLLNNPLTKNALSRALMKEMREALEELRFDREARVLILKSAVPGAFCAGADLKERRTMSAEDVPKTLDEIRRTVNGLAHHPLPVIAVLDGFALGGGLELALSCDIRIASSSAKMGLPETKLAIIPGAGGTQRLSRLVGLAKAKELILTGRMISGEEALQIGLVNHVVADPFDKALEIAGEILKTGPIASRLAKIAIDEGFQVEMSSALLIEQQCYAQTIGTKDRREALEAFAEKRAPVFKGE